MQATVDENAGDSWQRCHWQFKKTAMTVGQNAINIWQKYNRQLAKKAAIVGKAGIPLVEGASSSLPLLHHS
jgi:hypothetical protein